MSTSFKRQLLLGLLVLAIALIGMIVQRQWQATDSTKNRNYLYQQLLERSGQLNRDLPKLLDRQTRFERAEVVHYGMRFIYSLVGIDKYSHDEANIKQQLEPAMLRQYCQHDSLAFYREHADFLEIRYLDQNDQSLFTLRFVPTDCSG
ncbi:hypothetical protein AB8S08_06105 [Pseudidiomarina sp. PP-1MA]|uniref:Uncharacterized protein n=1 Tax=Pseudidiomarina sp. PP-1MA TaxID=3237706 RepID=A0AB39XB88_9GAMM